MPRNESLPGAATVTNNSSGVDFATGNSPPPGYDTYAIPLHPEFSQSLLPTDDPYAMVTHPAYPNAVPHRVLVNWNGKPGELVFDNGRQWAVDLWSVASQEKGRCIHAFCCAPCELRQQRSLLQRPEEDYQCCFDCGEAFCTCSGPCKCENCSVCCMSLEVCCCMPCSIRGVRRRMQRTRHLEHSWVPECGCGSRRPAGECCKPMSGHLVLGTANPCCIAILGVCIAATLVGQCNLMCCALAQQGHELRLFPEAGGNPSPGGPRIQIMVEKADAQLPNYNTTANNPRSPSASDLAHWSVLLHPKLSRSTLPDESASPIAHPAYQTDAREKVLVDISPAPNVYVMDRGRKWQFDNLLRIPCATPRQYAAALCCGPCEVSRQRKLLQRTDEHYQCCMDCGSTGTKCTCCGPWTCGCCGGACTGCCLCLEVSLCLPCAARGNRRRMQQTRQLSHSRVACCGCPRRRAEECLSPPKMMVGNLNPCAQFIMLAALGASCFGGCGLVCCAIAQQSHELDTHPEPRMGTEQYALAHSAAHRVVPNGPEGVLME